MNNYSQGLIDICITIITETNNNLNIKHPMMNKFRCEIYKETKEFPDEIKFPGRIRAIAKNDKCICENCGTIHGQHGKIGCCRKCALIIKNPSKEEWKEIYAARKLELYDKKYEGKIEGFDFVVCKICGQKSAELGSHVIRCHNISTEEYKTQFPGEHVKPLKIRDSIKGDKNPAYKHGGRLSPWSKNFLYGYNEERHNLQIKKHKQMLIDNKENNIFNIEYWLKVANNNEEMAKELYRKFQTRDLDWFINKYGDEEGAIRHQNKIEKWMKSFKKTNFSIISQKLFNEIAEIVDNTNIYYATFERDDMVDYKNKEYILKLETSYIRPDFIDIKLKKIIEFDGTYWHSEARRDPIREKFRDDAIISMGFEIYHIKEQDYVNNCRQVLKDCLEILTPIGICDDE